MGLCLSCKTSNAPIKDKSAKICGDISTSRICTTVEEVVVVNGLSITKQPPNSSMANSFNNMNFTNPIKELVSKNKNRYIKDGFNLDLTYITKQIIAMGYPASKIEAVYRNHIDDVVKMLESKHKDHYKIYNLCSERSYDTTKFHNRVQVFPFDDHNPPKIDLIKPFCEDVQGWLGQHHQNIAAVHCKAGKGRTGTMICCYLLHSQIFSTADEALSFYGQTRTQDRKGVTIPSQVRYVKYYERMVRENLTYEPVNVYIQQIVLEPPPAFTSSQGGLSFALSQNIRTDDMQCGKCPRLYKSPVYEVKKGQTNMIINVDLCLPIMGDIKLELYSKNKISKVKQFQFWFNTFFVPEEKAVVVVGSSEAAAHDGDGNGIVLDQNGGVNNANDSNGLVLTLSKNELDIVYKKDKQNKTFSSDFKITLKMQKVPKKSEGWLKPAQSEIVVPISQDSPSGSSEGDFSDEDEYEESEWDSGESTVV